MKAGWFHPSPAPCSDEIATQHLEAFIDAFVLKERRERIRVLLVENSRRRLEGLREVCNGNVLDPRRCLLLVGQESFPQILAARHPHASGVLVSDAAPATMTLPEAATWGSVYLNDGLFSVVAGTLAFVFDHHGTVYRCER